MITETQSIDITPATTEPEQQKPKRHWLKWLVYACLAVIALPFAMTIIYTFINPPFTTLMAARRLEGQTITRQWVALEKVSPALVKAVIASEDARFCDHHGVDWIEMRKVLDHSGGPNRGASTISMQLAKNLFLWSGHSYVRKALEVPLASWLDFILGKKRVMEIYLNSVEWGPGIFGAAAAAQYHFHKTPARLTAQEAALLAATLPNPLARKAAKPNARVKFLAGHILLAIKNSSLRDGCIREPRL